MNDIYEGTYYELYMLHGPVRFLPFSELCLPVDVGDVIEPGSNGFKEFVELFGSSIARITVKPFHILMRNTQGWWNLYDSKASALLDYIPVSSDHHVTFKLKNQSLDDSFGLKIEPGWFVKKLGQEWWQQILSLGPHSVFASAHEWVNDVVQASIEEINEKDIYLVRPRPPLWCDYFCPEGFYVKRGFMFKYKP